MNSSLKVALVCFPLMSVGLCAQTNMIELSLGYPDAPWEHVFRSSASGYPVTGGFCTSLAWTFGETSFADLTLLRYSVSAGYSIVSTEERHLYRAYRTSSSQFSLEETSLFLTARATSDATIAPFIEIGVGAMYMRTRELWIQEPSLNSSGTSVMPGLLYESGIGFRLSTKMTVSVAAGGTLAIGNHILRADDHTYSMTFEKSTSQLHAAILFAFGF